jgi:exodeoxyribonuclease VII small subunit
LALSAQKDYENDHVPALALSARVHLLMSASSAYDSVQPAAPVPAADVSHLSFEEALAELEKIVRGLETGQQKLEEAIAAFERGSQLRRHCEAKLAEAG